MQRINVYSSAAPSTSLSLAFLGLAASGIHVELRPLSELLTAPRPRPRLASLRAELESICIDLACIGERLSEHEAGTWRLDAGTEQGLKFDRDMLQTRKRGIEATLREEGGQGRG